MTAPLVTAPLATAPLATAPLATAPLATAPLATAPLAAAALVLPVVVAARHARLSAAHVELLFGAGAPLFDVCALPPTGTYACGELVEVRGATNGGAPTMVRVVGPPARQTEVRVSARDAQALALWPASACTLVGPRGTVVLAAGAVRVGLRSLTLTAADALQAGLAAGALALVRVQGERGRDLRDMPVELGAASYVSIDIDDANAIESGPATTATFSRA